MATIEFTAFPRATEGRGASRRLRRTGRAPGVVYGGTTAPTPIELDHNALIHALRNEAFHSSILTMKLDGGGTQVLLRDIQMHPFRHEVLHVDFQRVDPSRRIHMKVPLHFVNDAVSPAVKEHGAVVSHVMNEIDIICLPKDLPEFIEIDLSALDVGHSLHVSGVKFPDGVTAVKHRKVDPVVATAVVPKAIVETEETAVAAEGEAAAAPGAPAADAKAGEGAGAKGAPEAKKDDKKDDKKK
jgi:large subunit ribosomal protein L25